MLISRRSPRRATEGPFRSRLFGESAELPLRRYRTCRELVLGSTVHCGILAALILAMGLFTQSVWTLLRRHGAGVDPWTVRGVMALLGLTILLMVRRLVLRLRELGSLRRELADLARQIKDHDTPK